MCGTTKATMFQRKLESWDSATKRTNMAERWQIKRQRNAFSWVPTLAEPADNQTISCDLLLLLLLLLLSRLAGLFWYVAFARTT